MIETYFGGTPRLSVMYILSLYPSFSPSSVGWLVYYDAYMQLKIIAECDNLCIRVLKYSFQILLFKVQIGYYAGLVQA